MTRKKTKLGTFTKKRTDTKIWTIEKNYKIDLWVRSDMKLWNFLKKKWYPSLSKLLAS